MSFYKSFGYAIKGFLVALREQRNLKIQLAAACIVAVLAVWLQVTSTDWCILLLTIGVVITAELINSSLENLTDLVTKQHHPLAGKVKDMAAAAVLVMAVISFVVGIIIFAKYV